MKRFLFITLALITAWPVFSANPGYGQRRYSLTTMVEYGYNTTWGHHANFDVQALMPINPHFEMEAKMQFSTANVHSGNVQFRPKFELPTGELFLESDFSYRCIARNQIHDLTAGMSIGYRMDYVSVTIGVFARVMEDWNRSWYTDETFVVEPYNMLYRLEVFCRPQDNPWNVSFLFTNADDYQRERMWQPLFAVGAYYDVTDKWRINAGLQCKPTGMFHLDATFYGATFRAGCTYKF